ncbi:MAG: DUF368 domain-containing protein [Haloarculaceae archaeon]
MDASLRDLLRSYTIGLCMGTADGVPGVSGGTIALIAGVYTRLIDAITALSPRNGLRFLSALLPPDGGALRRVLDDVDAQFLLPLGVGIATALVLVTRVVDYADEHYPVALFGFFFGLIVASVVVLRREVVLEEPRHYAAAVGGFLLAFLVPGNVTLLSGHALSLVFVAGVIAISAMILPGISGALVLVVLGQYVYLSETLSTFTNRLVALLTGGSVDALVAPGTVVAVFLAGAVVGLLSIARLVDRALRRDPETTIAFLVALVAGALRAPIAKVGAKEAVDWTAGTITTFAIAALVGGVVLYGLDYYAIDVEIDVGRESER